MTASREMGHAKGGPSPRRLESREPATGALLGEVSVASREDVGAAIARARKAQAAWAVLPIEERCARLLRLRDALVDRAAEVVELVTRESGKPRMDALGHEVLVAIDQLGWYCKTAPHALGAKELGLHLLKHKKSVVEYIPRGVVGVVSPYGLPFVVPMSSVFAALVSGNAVIVKPSELTPLTMQRAKQIYDATGLPEDLFMVVQGGAEVGRALIEGGIQKLVFAGRVETGKEVAAACGANLVECVMVLTGKAPLVACADCDVERTARAVVFGGFANAGQSCVAVERVYAHEAICEVLLRRVRELTQALRQGDPSRDEVDVGAMTDAQQIAVCERHVADAVSKGARVVLGGARRPGSGQFFEPTVLEGCTHAMTVMTEEIFGPIVPFQKVASDDEAVRLANDSRLGLEAYVFTKDRAKGKRLARRIEAGSVLVNDVLVHYAAAEAPFGGTKQSGFGRMHGEDALRAMAESRHLMTGRFPEPFTDPTWFPYSRGRYRLEMRLVRALFGAGGVVRRIRELF